MYENDDGNVFEPGVDVEISNDDDDNEDIGDDTPADVALDDADAIIVVGSSASSVVVVVVVSTTVRRVPKTGPFLLDGVAFDKVDGDDDDCIVSDAPLTGGKGGTTENNTPLPPDKLLNGGTDGATACDDRTGREWRTKPDEVRFIERVLLY
jgi:hypothetical protein